MVLTHTFIESLHPKTKIVVNASTCGQLFENSFYEIYALMNKFFKRNTEWHRKVGRHTVHKDVGVLELNATNGLFGELI